jgi:hypothetical protein
MLCLNSRYVRSLVGFVECVQFCGATTLLFPPGSRVYRGQDPVICRLLFQGLQWSFVVVACK